MPVKYAIITRSHIWGGLEEHSVGLARTLHEQGCEVEIVCIGGDTYEMYRSMTASSTPLRHIGIHGRSGIAPWRRALAGISAGAVILQKGTLHTGTVSLDMTLRRRFGRYIAVEHLEPPVLPPRTSRGLFNGGLPGAGLWWYRMRLAGYVRSWGPSTTVCVSDAVRRALHEQYLFPLRKMVTVHNGIDLERFVPDELARLRARVSWSVPASSLVVGSVRRFVPEKGLDVAIRSFAGLPAEIDGRSLRLVLVGDGPERGALEALARAAGVSDRVVFPGFVSSPWTVYPGFDIFVLPSRVEALGAVTIEAFACGCAVVGTRVGGIPEIVEGEGIGRLVPSGDEQAMADAVLELVRLTPAEREAGRQLARQSMMDRFDMRTQYRKLGAIAAGTMGRAGNTRPG